MAIATDEAGIQFRTLNASKGPAVRATRAQADRVLYRRAIRHRLETAAQPHAVPAGGRRPARSTGDRVAGVVTQIGLEFEADAVVLTTGTFLSGLIHIGLKNYEAGRAGDPPAKRLGARLRELKLPAGRLKTGTPPRLDGRTIDFAALAEQPGDEPAPVFSFMGTRGDAPTPGVVLDHPYQRANARRSSGAASTARRCYTGVIKGVGAAVLPVDRGQGGSLRASATATRSSSNRKVLKQRRSIRTASRRRCRSTCSWRWCSSMPGCERAHILRPGYSIEYDYFDPRALALDARNQGDRRVCSSPARSTAPPATRKRRRRACSPESTRRRCAAGEDGWCPRRDEAYLGVLVDDLITRGVSEPYRMFTSRAEYRLQLREDNADLRLTEHRAPTGHRGRRAAGRRICRKRDAVAARARAAQIARASARSVVERHDAERVLGQPLERDQASPNCCAGPASPTQALHTLAGAGAPVDDAVVAEQVEIADEVPGLHRAAARRDRAAAR